MYFPIGIIPCFGFQRKLSKRGSAWCKSICIGAVLLFFLTRLLRFISSCLWSWTSWLWRRTMKCAGRSVPAGSSLRRTWRRRPSAGANLTWPPSPSAACWSFAALSHTVNGLGVHMQQSRCSPRLCCVCTIPCAAEIKSTRINMTYTKKENLNNNQVCYLPKFVK